MPKKKTSVNLEEDLWQKWVIYVVQRYGTSHKVSEALGEAIDEYMKNHPLEKADAARAKLS